MSPRPFATAALGVLIAASVLALAGMTDLPLSLGAHPWWAERVLWMGAAAGLAAFLLTYLIRPVPAGTVFALATASGLVAALWGGRAFAASFAENQFAGTLWFWGWIVAAAGLFGLTATLIRLIRRG